MPLADSDHLTVSSGAMFAEAARKFLGNLRFGFPDEDCPDAELASAPLGSCRLSRIEASAHGVEAGRAASGHGDSIKCLLQVEGQSILAQNGRAHAFGPRSWVVYDPTRPYQLHNRSRISQLLLQVPRRSFSSAALERLSSPHVLADDPAGVPRVVAAFARSTMEEIATLGDVARSRVGETLARLATTLISGEEDESDSEPGRLRMLRARVKAYLEANLSRSDLDIAEVAQRMGCSRRYIFLAFQAADTTPSQYLWDLRLERTREHLTGDSVRGGSISEIAFACGFSSTAHFSRAFRKRYGISPREARRRTGP